MPYSGLATTPRAVPYMTMLRARLPNITDFIEAWALSAMDYINSGSNQKVNSYILFLTCKAKLSRKELSDGVVNFDRLVRALLDE